MKLYNRRPGVICEEICGAYVLIATGPARTCCPEASRINRSAAEYWQLLEQPLSASALHRLMAEKHGVDMKTGLLNTLSFVSKFSSAGFLIVEETEEPAPRARSDSKENPL